MKIPYGISDFKSLRKESYLYVDKTKFIEQLDRMGAEYLFFIRPRRFGKSLFLQKIACIDSLFRQEIILCCRNEI